MSSLEEDEESMPGLHEWECVAEGQYRIDRFRVPGGWVYSITSREDSVHVVYVPYSSDAEPRGAAREGGKILEDDRCEDILPLYELPLPTRAQNGLANMGIQTVGELVTLSRKFLIKSPNIGRKTVDDITNILEEHGRQFEATASEDDLRRYAWWSGEKWRKAK